MSKVDLAKMQPQACLKKVNLSLKIDTVTYIHWFICQNVIVIHMQIGVGLKSIEIFTLCSVERFFYNFEWRISNSFV